VRIAPYLYYNLILFLVHVESPTHSFTLRNEYLDVGLDIYGWSNPSPITVA